MATTEQCLMLVPLTGHSPDLCLCAHGLAYSQPVVAEVPGAGAGAALVPPSATPNAVRG